MVRAYSNVFRLSKTAICVYLPGDLYLHFLDFRLPGLAVQLFLVIVISVILNYLYISYSDSPRVYVSTNPWKITATFQSVCSTREDYTLIIERLKVSAPRELRKGEKRTKLELAHLALIVALEGRIEVIDAELAVSVFQVLVARFCMLPRAETPVELFVTCLALMAASGITYSFALVSGYKRCEGKLNSGRSCWHRLKFGKRVPDDRPRNLITCIIMIWTARQAHRFFRFSHINLTSNRETQDDADEYAYQEDEGYDEEFDDDDFLNFRSDNQNGTSSRHASSSAGHRRSTRTSTRNANGKREASADSWGQWRGERRSSRLGAPVETQLDVEPPPKRARTEESTMSANSADATTSGGPSHSLKIKVSGAAALKPTEIALEQIAGKKRSKFWVYAVEPIPGVLPPPNATEEHATIMSDMNGHKSHGESRYTTSPELHENGTRMDYDRSLEGSLSPLDSA